jgi:hypothetical protein
MIVKSYKSMIKIYAGFHDLNQDKQYDTFENQYFIKSLCFSMSLLI